MLRPTNEEALMEGEEGGLREEDQLWPLRNFAKTPVTPLRHLDKAVEAFHFWS